MEEFLILIIIILLFSLSGSSSSGRSSGGYTVRNDPPIVPKPRIKPSPQHPRPTQEEK